MAEEITTTTSAATTSPAPVSESTTSTPASTPSTTSTPSTPTPAPESTSGAPATESTSDSGGKVVATGKSNDAGFVLVEENGRRVIRPAKLNEQTGTVETKTEPEPEGKGLTEEVIAEQPTQAAAEPYTLDEFSAALANNNIDERRVPQEYQKQYADFKINQAVKEHNRRQREFEEKQAQVNRQLTPEEKQEQMSQFLNSLEREAEARAKVTAGMTDEDMENIEYMADDDDKLIAFKLAKEWHKQELMQGLQQEAAEKKAVQQKQNAIYNDIRAFVDKAKAEEPNFDAIDKMLPERYKTLPYAEGRQIQDVLEALSRGTITEPQTAKLREYYEATRKEYYAKKNGLSTTPRAVAKPPVVEHAGDGRGSSKKYTPDYNRLKTANTRDRRAWLAEFLANKG